MRLITDGRFSGGTHGFVVGHITPEAQMGGNLALVKEGDRITIDAEKNIMNIEVSKEELETEEKNGNSRIIKLKAAAYLSMLKMFPLLLKAV